MGIVEDLFQRADQLSWDRGGYEAVWDEIARYCLPSAERSWQREGYKKLERRLTPQSTRDAPTLYDSTSVTLISRLAAGMEGLVAPQGEKWHGLNVDDGFGFEPSTADEQWLESTRDLMFSGRYDPRSGFHVAFQNALRRTIAFGTSVIYTEEAFATPTRPSVAVPVLYQHVPLAQCYLGVDAQGVCDTNFRRFSFTARQMVQKFGEDRVSEKVKAAANDQKRADEPFELLCAVFPRAEAGSSKGENRNSAFSSFWVEWDTKHMIRESGFYEFPYHVLYWHQAEESAYGESPVMEAIADVRRLQNTAKHTIRALQQSTDPPLALGADGTIRRPNLNPRALNYGALDEQGRERVKPLITATRPDFALEILRMQQEGLRESLYINLFQAMMDRSANSATEAMIRADEKAQLLGPAGAKIHAALSSMVEREFAIMARKGAFEPESRLAPPSSLQDREIKVRFASPLDRMRRSNEVLGIQQTYELAGAIAQIKQDPAIFDRLDDDEALLITREVTGAPARILRTDEKIAEIQKKRADEQQMMAAQQAMQLVQGTAQSASAAAGAAQDMSNVANQNPQAAEALGEMMRQASA